jgi:ABC-2 type transport system ATP-binding protein
MTTLHRDEAIVFVDGLHKTFPARSRTDPAVKAVDGVGFSVERGALVGLLGPNGAGKTTTIKALCGLIEPDAGELTVAGIDVRRRRRHALRHLAAVLEGNRNLYWRLTAFENLTYFAGNRGMPRRSVVKRIDELLERFDLGAKRDALVSSLSRGMQQKLALAVAALADTDVVLLDEPTLGLDVETGYEVRALLREMQREGRTVIVSTHDMPVVQDLCERTVVIAHGRVLVDDRVDHLMRLFASRAYEVDARRAAGPRPDRGAAASVAAVQSSTTVCACRSSSPRATTCTRSSTCCATARPRSRAWIGAASTSRPCSADSSRTAHRPRPTAHTPCRHRRPDERARSRLRA